MAAIIKTQPIESGSPPPVPNLGSTMVKDSIVHRKFLLSNSTSHVWPFGAIAELIDNAVDPDVKAKHVIIDVKKEQGSRPTMLTITDDGAGLDEKRLHKMLSFGFCEKTSIDDHHPIGHYGNGFKSGSMRLGRDALVFTRDKATRCVGVGFLSQSFNDAEQIEGLKVPIVFWNPDGSLKTSEEEAGQALSIIIRHSPFKTPNELFAELKELKNHPGTRILIYNLKKHGDQFELDFESDPKDIRINSYEDDLKEANQSDRPNHRPRRDARPYQQFRPGQVADAVPLDYSLRAYCEMLYFKPKTRIVIRGSQVRPHLIDLELAHSMKDTYQPKNVDDDTLCKFNNINKFEVLIGLSKDRTKTGFMLYHRGRLIVPYMRVGIQQRARAEAIGVVGVVQADFLRPTHNKQGFVDSPVYRACIQSLSLRLNDYWEEITDKRARGVIRPVSLLSQDSDAPSASPTQQYSASVTEDEIQSWAQCDMCDKWRALPPGTDVKTLPETWKCSDHPNPARAALGCAPESDHLSKEYRKHEDLAAVRSRKNHKKRARQQQLQQQQSDQDLPQSGSELDASIDTAVVKPDPLATSVADEEPPQPQPPAAETPADDIDIVAEETRDAPNDQSSVSGAGNVPQDQMEPQDDGGAADAPGHSDDDDEMQLDSPEDSRPRRSTRNEPNPKKRKSVSHDEEADPPRRHRQAGANYGGSAEATRSSKRRKIEIEPREDTQIDAEALQPQKKEVPIAEVLAAKLIKLAGAVTRLVGNDIELPEDPEEVAEMDIDSIISSLRTYAARNNRSDRNR